MARKDAITVNLRDLYTPEDLRRATIIYNSLKAVEETSVLKDTLRDQIVRPRMPRINLITGQRNDSNYMAYQLIALFADLEKKQNAGRHQT